MLSVTLAIDAGLRVHDRVAVYGAFGASPDTGGTPLDGRPQQIFPDIYRRRRAGGSGYAATPYSTTPYGNADAGPRGVYGRQIYGVSPYGAPPPLKTFTFPGVIGFGRYTIAVAPVDDLGSQYAGSAIEATTTVIAAPVEADALSFGSYDSGSGRVTFNVAHQI